jgi:hypothetical protein
MLRVIFILLGDSFSYLNIHVTFCFIFVTLPASKSVCASIVQPAPDTVAMQSAAWALTAWALGLWVQILLKAWMLVCFCVVLSCVGRGLIGLITC